MSRIWRRIRYSSRSSGPSKASRNTYSASRRDLWVAPRSRHRLASPPRTASRPAPGPLRRRGSSTVRPRSSLAVRGCATTVNDDAGQGTTGRSAECMARRHSSSVSPATSRAFSKPSAMMSRTQVRDLSSYSCARRRCPRPPRPRLLDQPLLALEAATDRRRATPGGGVSSLKYTLCRSHTGHFSGSPGRSGAREPGESASCRSFGATRPGPRACPIVLP